MTIFNFLSFISVFCISLSLQYENQSNHLLSKFDIEPQCMPKCLQCKKGPNSCTKCSEGANCCNWPCQKCQNQTECKACKQGFQLDENLNICIFQYSCQTNFCVMCSENNICLACDYRYYLNSEMRTCESCPPKCFQCLNSYECTLCQPSFYKKDGVCKQCIQNCFSCNDSMSCTTCVSGHFINKDSKCQKCVEQCDECSSKQDCLQCSSGYFFDQALKRCLRCPQQCVECKSQDECISCASDYFLNTTTKKCLLCKDFYMHCMSCQTVEQKIVYFNSNQVICTSCEPRYYLQKSQCKACGQNCKQCTNQTTCTQCRNSYFINDQNQCQFCPIYRCLVCLNSKVCQICAPGSYWNPSISYHQCTNCSMGCQQCDQFGCTICMVGFYLKNGNCQKCDASCMVCINGSNNCQSCLIGYFKVSFSVGHCYKCPLPCIQCRNLTNCTRCMPQYYLSKNTCKKCTVQNCDHCKPITTNSSFPQISSLIDIYPIQDRQKCVQCSFGYILKENQCVKCFAGCHKCLDLQTCISCSQRYYSNNQKTKCIACPENCLQCQPLRASINFCTSCQSGYSLDKSNTKCLPCSQNCLQCTVFNQNGCYNCKDGFYLKQSNGSQNICVECKRPCKNCEEQTQCLSCVVGYYFNVQDECIKCEEGCQQCSEDGCFICEPGYRLQYENLTCVKCKVDKCFKCQSSQNLCDTCEDGYQYFVSKSNGQKQQSGSSVCFRCDQQIQGCRTCNSPQQCTGCFSGLTLELSQDGLSSTCKKQNDYLGFFIAIGVLSLSVMVLIGIICVLRYKRNKLLKGEGKSEKESVIQRDEYSINSQQVFSGKGLRKSLRSSFGQSD